MAVGVFSYPATVLKHKAFPGNLTSEEHVGRPDAKPKHHRANGKPPSQVPAAGVWDLAA